MVVVAGLRYTWRGMQQITVIREWDADSFHAKVMELESQGWHARHDTYKITPEMNPETGFISHVHQIELVKPDQR